MKSQDTFASAHEPFPNYEVPVPRGSPVIGKSVGELKFWQSTGDVGVLAGSPAAAEAAHKLLEPKEERHDPV